MPIVNPMLIVGIVVGIIISVIVFNQLPVTGPTMSDCQTRTIKEAYAINQDINFYADIATDCFNTMKWQISSGEYFVCGIDSYNPSMNRGTCECTVFPKTCNINLPTKA